MQPIRSSTSSTSEAPGCDGLRRGHRSRNRCPRRRCHPPGTLAAHRAPSGALASPSSNRPNGRVRSIPGIPVGSAADDRHHDSPGPARRGWPGPARRGPLCGWPALAGTARMAAGTCPGHAAARSGCARDRYASLSRTPNPANSAPGSTASSSPLPGARPVGSGKGRCARNGSARRVCRPVMDEHARRSRWIWDPRRARRNPGQERPERS